VIVNQETGEKNITVRPCGVSGSGVVDAVHLPFPGIPHNFRPPVPELTMKFHWMGGKYEFVSLKIMADSKIGKGLQKERAVAGEVSSLQLWSGKGGRKTLSWSLW
jgi:hypothetical protein